MNSWEAGQTGGGGGGARGERERKFWFGADSFT